MTDFDALAASSGVEVFFGPAPASGALALEDAVCLDFRLIGRDHERALALAHELGHIMTGSLYSSGSSVLDRRRAELRARRWAARHIISRAEILKAFRSGARTVPDLSSFLGLPPDLIDQALEIYHLGK